MKSKPDEMFDEQIRHLLDQLPDTPPPGSIFNPDQLWQRIHTSQPHRRRLFVGLISPAVRWKSAVCVCITVISWYSAQQPIPSVNKRWIQPKSTAQLTQTPTTFEDTIIERNRQRLMQYKDQEITELHSFSITDTHIGQVAKVPPAVVQADSSQKPGNQFLDTTQTIVANSYVRRRLRIMHENDLHDERENAPKLYRPEGFVRMRITESEDRAVDVPSPSLTFPITRKNTP